MPETLPTLAVMPSRFLSSRLREASPERLTLEDVVRVASSICLRLLFRVCHPLAVNDVLKGIKVVEVSIISEMRDVERWLLYFERESHLVCDLGVVREFLGTHESVSMYSEC